MLKKLIASIALGAAVLGFSGASFAQAASAPEAAASAAAVAAAPAEAASAAAAPAPVPNKGDTALMMVATALVIMMTIPGLALFYGGLVRSKNMLSVLMQVFMIFSLISVLWVVYGYSLAFTAGNAFIGTLDRLFLKGITPESMAATFSKGVYIPELTFVAFQATFAAITDRADRRRLRRAHQVLGGAAVHGAVVHVQLSADRAHGLVLDGPGRDQQRRDAGDGDCKGRLHVGQGRARLRRRHRGAHQRRHRRPGGRLHDRQARRLRKESMTPHSLTLTMVGASMLWVGWFGFNAGSNLEANGVAALAFINTFVATAAAMLAWAAGEALMKGKASMLGAASGAVAGLVAITPACGYVGVVGALVIGLLAGFICLWGVNGLKSMLGADDSLDVFGVHGVGGILGALLTGVFASPSLGGTGICDCVTDKCGEWGGIGSQVWIQLQGVLLTLVWSGVVAFIAYKIVDMVIGLRVPEDEEREGLDITSHGETAYSK